MTMHTVLVFSAFCSALFIDVGFFAAGWLDASFLMSVGGMCFNFLVRSEFRFFAKVKCHIFNESS